MHVLIPIFNNKIYITRANNYTLSLSLTYGYKYNEVHKEEKVC